MAERSEKRNTKRVAPDIVRDERRKAVAAGMLRGLSERQIAADIGCSCATVSRDVQVIRTEWREHCALTYEELVQQETARYDVALGGIWGRVARGELEAIDRFVKLSQARRELLGLDAPKRTELRAKIEMDDPLEALETQWTLAADQAGALEQKSVE